MTHELYLSKAIMFQCSASVYNSPMPYHLPQSKSHSPHSNLPFPEHSSSRDLSEHISCSSPPWCSFHSSHTGLFISPTYQTHSFLRVWCLQNPTWDTPSLLTCHFLGEVFQALLKTATHLSWFPPLALSIPLLLYKTYHLYYLLNWYTVPSLPRRM